MRKASDMSCPLFFAEHKVLKEIFLIRSLNPKVLSVILFVEYNFYGVSLSVSTVNICHCYYFFLTFTPKTVKRKRREKYQVIL